MQNVFSVPVFKAGIILVSSSFYGIFFVLFVLSTLILNRQGKRDPRSQMSSTNSYLVSSYMMFVVLSVIWIISAIISFNPTLAHLPGPTPLDIGPLMFAQHIIGYLASLIGDLVMIYRLYVIWDQKKVIIWIGGVVEFIGVGLSIAVIVHFAEFQSVFVTPNMILAGLSISINVVTTVLIARKVWKRTELTRAVGGKHVVYKLIAIIIESCALYTFWMLSFLISHFANLTASQVFLYGSPHVAGIASVLVNVRVGLGWALGEEGRTVRSFHESGLVDSHPNHDLVESRVGGSTV